MLTSATTDSMGGWSLPAPTELVSRAAAPGETAPAYLVPEGEALHLVLENAKAQQTVYVTARRLAFTTRTGGMMGRRFETFSIELARVAAFATTGSGGLSGDLAILLLVPGVGVITLDFAKGADLEPMASHLTRHSGR